MTMAYGQAAAWRCTHCGARGDDASYERTVRPGGGRCPRCNKRVEGKWCSSGMLCFAVGLPYDRASKTGAGIHENPEQARYCERRMDRPRR